jgi:hypothetical protein
MTWSNLGTTNPEETARAHLDRLIDISNVFCLHVCVLFAAAYQLWERRKQALYAYPAHVHILPGHKSCSTRHTAQTSSDHGTINHLLLLLHANAPLPLLLTIDAARTTIFALVLLFLFSASLPLSTAKRRLKLSKHCLKPLPSACLTCRTPCLSWETHVCVQAFTGYWVTNSDCVCPPAVACITACMVPVLAS